MKKILINLVCFLLIFCCMNTPASAAEHNEIFPRANNFSSTFTDFTINNNGTATVVVKYMGIDGVTSGAKITVKIQKRFLLVFWNDVDGASWVDNASGVYYSNSHSISVKSGYYRAQVEYTIYGSGGAADVVTEQIEAEN